MHSPARSILPLWNWISEKTDKRKAYVVGMIFLSVVMCGLIFLDAGVSMPLVLGMSFLAGIGEPAGEENGAKRTNT